MRKKRIRPYWSVTRFNDIIAVEGAHEIFSSSSELGGITIFDGIEESRTTSFIGLDPPDHDAERKAVAPMFSTASMAAMAPSSASGRRASSMSCRWARASISSTGSRSS
ncbi:MAG: hypothetical protein ACYC8V_05895 [Caulobacteraceae bacterium]